MSRKQSSKQTHQTLSFDLGRQRKTHCGQAFSPGAKKFEAWIARVTKKFQSGIEDTKARGRVPNLRNQAVAAGYRDSGNEELVFRGACLMTSSEGVQGSQLSASRKKEVWQEFLSGLLDEDLLDECRLMRSSFKFSDLAFMRNAASCSMEPSPDPINLNTLDAAEKRKLEAEREKRETERREKLTDTPGRVDHLEGEAESRTGHV